MVLPSGDISRYPHDEVFDAVHDALLSVTPWVDVLRVRFGGDEDYATLIATTDITAWIPHGERVLKPREDFFASEDMYEGVWVGLGQVFQARQMVRYFELLPDAGPAKNLGLSVSRRWVERLVGSGESQDEEDLELLRGEIQRFDGLPEADGLNRLIGLMSGWQDDKLP